MSNVAGTTRDATDTTVENEDGKFVLIDTAGIRKKARVTERIEHYSVLRAYMAVDRADVCLILIDATEGFTEQDSKVAGYAHEQGKASIIVVNKWDLIEKDNTTMKEFEGKIAAGFQLHVLRSVCVHFCKDGGSVWPQAVRKDSRSLRAERYADLHRHAERCAGICYHTGAAALG